MSEEYTPPAAVIDAPQPAAVTPAPAAAVNPAPAPSGAAVTQPAPSTSANLAAHIGEDGKFKAGWSKALGVSDALEKKFTEPSALLKSYVSLEKMLHDTGKVSLPTKDSTPEERQAFNKKLGVPDKPEDYGIKMPEKIGDKVIPKEAWIQKRADDFAKVAHEIGLTPAQATRLVEHDTLSNMASYTGVNQHLARIKSEAESALKTEWGADYDSKLKLAEVAAKEAGFDGPANPELANSPAFIRAMAKVGAMIVEQPAAGARGTSHAPTNIEGRIKELRIEMTTKGYKNTDPRHGDRMAELKGLLDQQQASRG